MDSGDILKEEYTALRAEICQSIAQQHHILLSGYGAVAAVIGFAFGSNALGPKALLIVPMLTLAMVALWAVECNRMVRASYYIAYVLWPLICRESRREEGEGWESWIRVEGGAGSNFRLRQHRLQQIVSFYIPISIGAISIGLAAYTATSEHPSWWLPIGAVALVSAPIWAYLYVAIGRISDLRGEMESRAGGPQAAAEAGPLP